MPGWPTSARKGSPVPPDDPTPPAPSTRDVPGDVGVVDRIVDGRTAVVLVGPDEDEHHLAADQLPADVTEGTWVRVAFDDDGQIAAVGRDEDVTSRAAQAAEDRLARIRSRRTGGRFGSDGSS